MDIWLLDPKSKQKSVSLTILMMSVVYLLTLGVLNALGKMNSMDSSLEFFGIASGLYFGRRNVSIAPGQVNITPTDNKES